MSARILDGKAVAKEIRGEVAAGAKQLLAGGGAVPGLAVLLVGEHPASTIYVRNKARAAEKAGLRSIVRRLPVTTSTDELLGAVGELNADPAVHGILVQLPLPDGVDAGRVLDAVDPAKDVDGFHPINVGLLSQGRPRFVPCTPAGILEMLRRCDIPLEGRRAVVIGRSNIVGRPMATLLLAENATVTVCHSRTRDLASVAHEADILIAAVGRKALVTEEFVRPGAVVVDVGIHRVEDEAEARDLFGDDAERLEILRSKGFTLVGDVHPARVAPVAGWLTPVPGGVGPLTIAMVLKNTLHAARLIGS